MLHGLNFTAVRKITEMELIDTTITEMMFDFIEANEVDGFLIIEIPVKGINNLNTKKITNGEEGDTYFQALSNATPWTSSKNHFKLYEQGELLPSHI